MTKPSVTGTSHPLPFDQLSARDFERLCLWLVDREGYQQTEYLGASGSEQGRDILARWEGKQVAFQCKRVKRFGPKDVLKEVDKLLGLPETNQPDILIFIVTCDVSVKARDVGRQGSMGQMEIDFWALAELDEKVKKHADIVEEFFQITTESERAEAIEGYEIIFDESHGQGDWIPVKPTIDEHFHAIGKLAGERYKVGYTSDGKQLSGGDFSQCKLFILTIGPRGRTNLSKEEIRLLQEFVRNPGCCLLVISTYDGDAHHKANLNDLLHHKYGIKFNYDVIMPENSTKDDAYVQAGHYNVNSRLAFNAYPTNNELPQGDKGFQETLLKDIKEIRALSCCSIYLSPQSNTFSLLASDPNCRIYEQEAPSWGYRSNYKNDYQDAAILMAASKDGKVIALGGWKMFIDEFINDQRYDNKQLFINILDWVGSL